MTDTPHSLAPNSQSPNYPTTQLPNYPFAWAIALLAVAVRAGMAWKTHSTGEDFLITLRYAENIAAGHGFVYNPGERVLGTTTPLYTLLLALAACLHLDAAMFGKACNILADGVTCLLLARLLARPEIGQPKAGLFAALLYAFSSTPISISISGMETGLVTCAGLILITAYVTRRSWTLWIAGAFLVLLRIDGLLLLAILGIGLAWQTRRIPWREMGLFLLLLLPWLIFAFAYFGSPIPTSLIAKVTVYTHGMEVPHEVIWEAFAIQFARGWQQQGLTLLFVAGMMQVFLSSGNSPADEFAAGKAPRGMACCALPLLWLLLYYGVMLTSRVPAFAWYFLPPWPLYLGLAALGGSGALRQVGRVWPAVQTPALQRVWPLALLAFGGFGFAHLPAARRSISDAQRLEDEVRAPLGLWLKENARPNERILLEPIGYIGYYSQRPILDMIGLVSPEVLPSYRAPGFLADIIHRLRPDWLCLRPREVALLISQDDTLPEAQYEWICAFPAPPRAPEFLLYHRRQDSTPQVAQ